MITNEQFEAEMEHPTSEELGQPTNEELVRTIQDMQRELARLREQPKNQRPGKPGERNRYVRLGEMKVWGKVPQQQADLAAILAKGMTVGVEYSEAEVFNILIEGTGDYRSLYTSKQDVTYLFKYYRGLKKDTKRCGFLGRDFLKIV